MIKESKDNNELGRKMENSAKTFLKEANIAFKNLNTEHDTMEGNIYNHNSQFGHLNGCDMMFTNYFKLLQLKQVR